MTDTYGVVLHHVQSKRDVDAVLTERVSGRYVLDAEEAWGEYLQAARKAAEQGEPYAEPEHQWDWSAKHKQARGLLSYVLYGIDVAGEVQGLMLLSTDKYFCRLPAQKDLGVVDITFLATAPWNNKRINGVQRYKGVGAVMLHTATKVSSELGFKGRLRLHSLKGAESFYDGHGMQCLGPDPKCGNLKYYETTPEWATEFLR